MGRTRLNKPAALRRLRNNLDELEAYVTRIADHVDIPAAHLEKDFWVTEVLRGAAVASTLTGCSVIFKGGTSLSKAHRLIRRFSEDIDLIVVMPQGGKGSRDTTLKRFAAAAATATGIAPAVDRSSATKGVKRTAVFEYPTGHTTGQLKSGVLMELGTRGGALPHRRLPIRSLIAEHAETAGLPIDFVEAAPTNLLVLEPVRTLVEKIVLLHHAATEGDERRQRLTARHYYDIDRLLRDEAILNDLEIQSIDVLAREVTSHSQAVGLPTAERPVDGFASSPAWNPKTTVVKEAYEATLRQLVWPGAPKSTFEECCSLIRDLRDRL